MFAMAYLKHKADIALPTVAPVYLSIEQLERKRCKVYLFVATFTVCAEKHRNCLTTCLQWRI